MTSRRYKPSIRRDLILNAAVSAARKPGGWSLLTRQVIAEAAECSEGLVSRYLGDMGSARRAVMKEAIKAEIMEIIAQSIVAHDGYAIKTKLKQKALASLLG